MTSFFEEARKTSTTMAQIRHELMLGFLEHRYTQGDIGNRFNEFEERTFWEEFRIHYQNADNDRSTFIERLETSVHGRDGGTALNRGNAPAEFNPKEAAPIEPLPEPIVPRSGRGRRNPSGEQSTVVRAIRRIGRFFGIRNS